MSIRLRCEHCGQPIDLDDRFAGLTGRCQHCGHSVTVPAAAATASPLQLKPVEGLDAPLASPALHPSAPALRVRPLPGDDPASAPVEPPVAADSRPVEVLDPDHRLDQGSRRTPLNPHYETRLARWLARSLRETRDRLYLLSIALLVLTLIGFLFKMKPLVHLGTVGVVLTNIVMLADGIFYLLVLPFQHSLAAGLGTLFPPYAVYYWIKHWGRMRQPVVTTARSFTPIFLAALAYACYQESPVIWDKVQQADRVVEQALGAEPGPAPAPRPRQPTVADQAKRVLGNEANIIQDLARPE